MLYQYRTITVSKPDTLFFQFSQLIGLQQKKKWHKFPLIEQGCDFTIIRLHIEIRGKNSLLNIELNENPG
jgi:hypothetical protein